MLIMMITWFLRLIILSELYIRVIHKVLKLIHNLSIIIILINFGNIHFEFLRVSWKHNMWRFDGVTLHNGFLKDLIDFWNWISIWSLWIVWCFLIVLKHLFDILFLFFSFLNLVLIRFLFGLSISLMLMRCFFW